MFYSFRDFIRNQIEYFTKAPFVGITLFLIAGIVSQQFYPCYYNDYQILILFVISTIICVAFSYIFLKFRILCLYFWFAVLGYISTYHIKQLYAPLSGNVQVTAVICAPLFEKQKTYKTEICCELANGRYAKAILYIAKDSMSKKLQFGDIISVSGNFKEITNRANQTFDYKAFLAKRFIYSQVFVSSTNWEKLGRKSSIASYSNTIREHILTILRATKLTQENFALITAIVFGDKSYIDSSVSKAFTATGVMHILSVSGLHVAIMSMILIFVIRLCTSNKLLHGIFTVTGIWMYSFITGICPSVQRAAIMATMLVISALIERRNIIFNSLAFSAFISLLINPFDLFDIGFQLSYLAVIGIAYCNPIIQKLLHVTHPVYKYIWDIISVSISVQIVTLPISFYYFGMFPLYSILANVIVIPISFVLLCTALLLLTVWFIPYVSDIVTYVLHIVTDYLVNVLFDISSFPKSQLYIHINFRQMMWIYALLLLVLLLYEYCKELWIQKNIRM